MGEIGGAEKKPWLTPAQQIVQLKSQGVRFVLMTEGDAEEYLKANNNYFRLRSYRVNFEKVKAGSREGEYENLDFKMLVDLSIVDMLLRSEMLPMTLDIEHFSKVLLLKEMRRSDEGGTPRPSEPGCEEADKNEPVSKM